MQFIVLQNHFFESNPCYNDAIRRLDLSFFEQITWNEQNNIDNKSVIVFFLQQCSIGAEDIP